MPPPSAGKSANRSGELERMSKNYDARRTVRRRCLSEPMTNLLSPFEGVDRKLRGEKDGEWKQSFQPSIPFLARLELCHVEINCFTRPRNIVTRTFESRDVGSTGLSCKVIYGNARVWINLSSNTELSEKLLFLCISTILELQ